MCRFILPAFGLACLALAETGCSTSGAKGFNPFPQGHRLTETAQSLRSANAGGVLQVPRELEKEPLPSYTVEPGDVLLVQPADLDSPVRLPGDQPILPDGTINLGKYGHLTVAGKTVTEIEAMVRGAVQAQKTPGDGFISVRIVSRQSKVYYVVGEVNAPGAFPLNGRETVLDALMAAGGLTDNASRNNIVLSRPSRPCDNRSVLPACFQDIVQLADTTTNYQLAPGDRIYVPSRTVTESLFGFLCKECPCNPHQTPCALPRTYCGAGGTTPEDTGIVETNPAPAQKRTETQPKPR